MSMQKMDFGLLHLLPDKNADAGQFFTDCNFMNCS